MRDTVFSVFIAFCFNLVPEYAYANCDDFLNRFSVPAPRYHEVPADTELRPGECSPVQMEMFARNLNAIEEAVAIDDPNDLVGTWLGDDVLLALQGVVLGGQEVLQISFGDDEDTLVFEHYMYRSAPLADISDWDEKGYAGLISSTVYRFSFEENQPLTNLFLQNFKNRDFIFDQNEANNEALNTYFGRFAQDVKISRNQSSLVVSGPSQVSTFTKISSKKDADLAFLIVNAQQLPFLTSFECTLRQIIDKESRLVKELAPYDTETAYKLLSRVHALGMQHEVISSANARSFSEEKELQRISLYDTLTEAESDPQYQEVVEKLQALRGSGCWRLL